MQTGKKKYCILGVCGAISAYKSAYLARLLMEKFDLRVVMTTGATKFITPLIFRAISSNQVFTGTFEAAEHEPLPHINEARKASIIVVAPATADFISRICLARADDLLSLMVLCSKCPVLLAPAMNTAMWESPLLQENVRKLSRYERFHFIGPDTGKLLCGGEGKGRMCEPETIFKRACCISRGGRHLYGKKIVITAGPTIEKIDPIRFISNFSSGMLGYSLAEEACARKANVTLISGRVNLNPPPEAKTISVTTAEEMLIATIEEIQGADILFMTAAVADFKPLKYSKEKIKKESKNLTFNLKLTKTSDILSEISKMKKQNKPIVFGFNLETRSDMLLKFAEKKLRLKGCDFIVSNLASQSLGKKVATIVLRSKKGRIKTIKNKPKDEIAFELMEIAAKELEKL